MITNNSLFRSRNTLYYVTILSLGIALLVSTVKISVKYHQRLYLTPVTITAANLSGVQAEVMTKNGRSLTASHYEDCLSIQEDHFSSLTITADSSEIITLSIGTKQFKNTEVSPGKPFSIRNNWFPINIDIDELRLDWFLTFLFSGIKFGVSLLLITYLLGEKCNLLFPTLHPLYRCSSLLQFIVELFRRIRKILITLKQNKHLLAALFLLSLSCFPIIITAGLRFHGNNHFFLFIFTAIHKLIFDPLLYATIVILILKFLHSRVLAIFALSFSILCTLSEAAVFFFGFTTFERNHLSLITPYSLLGFISWQMVGFILFFICLLIPVNYLTLKGTKKFGAANLVVLLVLIVSGITNLSEITYPIIAWTAQTPNASEKLREQQGNLRYVFEPSLLNVLDELFLRPIFNRPVPFTQEKFKDTARFYGIPYGKKEPGLNALENPFPVPEKIIMFTSESLSMSLLSAYNKKIPVKNSYFYELEEIQSDTLKSMQTSAHNTLQGLTTIFTSHPNFGLQIEGKEYHLNLPFPKILKENGYQTIFLRSASKYFANEDKIFAAFGFDEIIGREDFEKTDPQYVKNWGVADRILYQKLIELLETRKEEKLFIVILGTDTHPLDGRKDYFDLSYPFAYETDFSALKRSGYILNSVAHHAYDLEQLYFQLKEKSLLNEKNCFIFTADHSSPLNSATAAVPGYPLTSLDHIPFIILYEGLPKLNDQLYCSQIDIAPTLLDILHLPIPETYWGDSLFKKKRLPVKIGFDQDRIFIKHPNKEYVINTKSPQNKRERELIQYFYSLGK